MIFLVSTQSDRYYCDIFIHGHDVQVLLLHPAGKVQAKGLCYKRPQRQALVLMNIGSGPQVPGSRKQECIRELGRCACQQEKILAWGRPWRSSLVNCRVHSECKAQHSTDNHPATPEKYRNLQCECNLIMQVHHAT